MKKSVIASLVASSFILTGLSAIPGSFAQSTPSPSMPGDAPATTPGGAPTTPGSAPGGSSVPDSTTPGGSGGSMPAGAPEVSPDTMKKPAVKKNKNKKKSKKVSGKMGTMSPKAP